MGTCPGQAHKAAGCFALAILLWACLGGCALASDWRWQGDNGLQLDDNAGLASDGTRQRRTAIVSQRLNGRRPLLRAPHHAVDSAIGLHLAQALRYPGLSHLDAQLGLGWHWQPGAGFHATQWGLELRGGARWSVDTARDGWLAQLTASAQQQLTTRLRSEWRLNGRWQEAQAAAFSTGLHQLSLQLDWLHHPRQVLYLRVEGLEGSFTTTVTGMPARPGSGAVDRAFDPQGERAYRRHGAGTGWLLGLNRSLSQQLVVDAAVHHVRLHQADTGYQRTQWMLNLLYRL